MPPKRIRVILMGGTIDAKSYKDSLEFKEKGEAPDVVEPLPQSEVKHYLGRQYPRACEFSLIELKDSQKINAVDTDELLTLIADTPEPVKIITIGTDAMARKAREVATRLASTDKVVLFVGAMEPLSHGAQSDGYGNLDFVMQAAGAALAPGVYAAMPDQGGNHRVFHADAALHKEKSDTRVAGGRQYKYFTGNVVDIVLPAPTLSR